MTQDEISQYIETHLVTKSLGLKPDKCISEIIRQSEEFSNLMQNAEMLCLSKNLQRSEAMYWMFHRLSRSPTCLNCDKPVNFEKFKHGYRKFCSVSCSTIFNRPSSKWDLATRARVASITSKTHSGKIISHVSKQRMRDAAVRPDVRQRMQSTNLIRYGVENTGVLGAYASKSGRNYIEQYILQNNLDPTLCQFNRPGEKEIYQLVDVPFLSRKKYCSYDLVVFADSEAKSNIDISKITTVLEFNGPWHYKMEEIVGAEDEPATPYSTNKYTKLEQVIIDQKKLSHIYEMSRAKVLVYWDRTKTLETWIP